MFRFPLMTMGSVLVAFALPAAALATGCVARVVTGPAPAYAYEETYTAPPNVYAAPTTYYAGRPIYYVDGRWYFQHQNHWAYYRDEPPELVRHRGYVQQAPPAYGYGTPQQRLPGYGYGTPQQAPPAYGPAYGSPPRATRVQ